MSDTITLYVICFGTILAAILIGLLMAASLSLKTFILANHRLRDDAMLGRIAMRFVDRAGDTTPDDSAERICREFNAAMTAEIERQRAWWYRQETGQRRR